MHAAGRQQAGPAGAQARRLTPSGSCSSQSSCSASSPAPLQSSLGCPMLTGWKAASGSYRLCRAGGQGSGGRVSRRRRRRQRPWQHASVSRAAARACAPRDCLSKRAEHERRADAPLLARPARPTGGGLAALVPAAHGKLLNMRGCGKHARGRVERAAQSQEGPKTPAARSVLLSMMLEKQFSVCMAPLATWGRAGPAAGLGPSSQPPWQPWCLHRSPICPQPADPCRPHAWRQLPLPRPLQAAPPLPARAHSDQRPAVGRPWRRSGCRPGQRAVPAAAAPAAPPSKRSEARTGKERGSPRSWWTPPSSGWSSWSGACEWLLALIGTPAGCAAVQQGRTRRPSDRPGLGTRLRPCRSKQAEAHLGPAPSTEGEEASIW